MDIFIEDIRPRQILDSRGNPTIEVDVILSNGVIGRASTPSGASTGKYEALELRDKNKNYYFGRSVLKAIDNINHIIAPNLIGEDATNQKRIDDIMIKLDNTINKSRLGANAILPVSIAVLKACANSFKTPVFQYLGGMCANTLPIPMMNILNGGAHADNGMEIQEFMIFPIGAKSFHEALEMGSNVFHTLKDILRQDKLSTSVGDEGGFAPYLDSNEEAIEYILRAIEASKYTTCDIKICLDVASSEFYKNKTYSINASFLKNDEMVSYLEELVNKYPIYSIEDGMAQDDMEGWKLLTKKLGKKCQLVGDDLFVTNASRLKNGIKEGIANSILIKPNQIGTVTEAIETVKMAKQKGYKVIASHRSGETEDTFICDFCVGLGIEEIKIGSLSRGERISKYNQLLRIEELLEDYNNYSGQNLETY